MTTLKILYAISILSFFASFYLMGFQIGCGVLLFVTATRLSDHCDQKRKDPYFRLMDAIKKKVK